MKYRPEFPERFDSLADARAYCQTFFAWYNYDHRHSGIGYMTPAAMHTGVAPIIHEQRAQVLQKRLCKASQSIQESQALATSFAD